ncbi:MAG: hypothetical protein WB797_11735, partial [Nocardioides sp.]
MSMRTHALLSRVFALASCGALITGLAFVSVGPASAAIPSMFEVEGVSNADSSCTVTAGSPSVINGPKVLHHGRAKGAVNLDTTWTSGTNSSDITTVAGHFSSHIDVTAPHDVLKSATLTGTGTVRVSRALGSSSTCNVSATLASVSQFETHQKKAGWFYVTRDSSKGSVAEVLVSNEVTHEPAVLEIYQGGSSSVTVRGFVQRGTYVNELVAGIQAGATQILLKNGGSVSRTSLKNVLTESFHNAGSAFAKAKGSGTKFVRFPGSLSCSHHSATLTWKSGASKVATGSFLVNGKKMASVSGPKAGHHVVLRHLGRTADNTISAQLSLKGGGRASATDLFVPCHD